MIDKKKLEEKRQSEKRVRSLENRIIINYAIAVLAFMIFRVLVVGYTNPNVRNAIIFSLAAVMVIAAVVFYVLNKKTGKTKNYGHMFVAFALALLFSRGSIVLYKLFGQNVFEFIYDIKIAGLPVGEKLLNAQFASTAIAWLGGIYLVAMTIFNGVLIHNETSKKKNKK